MENRAKKTTGEVSRRDFIKTSATTAASLAAMTAGASRIYAAGSEKMTVALIGCGGRGNGALRDCMNAAKHIKLKLELVATADWFKDRAEKAGARYGLGSDRCFDGATGYQKALACKPDIMVTAATPCFRPAHLEAAINAGVHVFMEKPVAVDPPGIRRIIAAGEKAKQKGLAIVAGTQRRHEKIYLRNQYLVEHGAIGEIKGGCVWWCGRVPWIRPRKPGQNDADYLVQNWLNFYEMSGDHIVEQHVHNLDVANWFIGRTPRLAIGFGGRARRKTGNQFDFFSVDLDYGEDLHIHSMCRQLTGCYDRVSELFNGSEGSIQGGGSVKTSKNITVPDFFEHEGGPKVQEHVDLLNSIVAGKPLNEARTVAESTMTAIMCRMACYTGELVRWSDCMDKKDSKWYNYACKPTADDFEKGSVTAPSDDVISIPGKADERFKNI